MIKFKSYINFLSSICLILPVTDGNNVEDIIKCILMNSRSNNKFPLWDNSVFYLLIRYKKLWVKSINKFVRRGASNNISWINCRNCKWITWFLIDLGFFRDLIFCKQRWPQPNQSMGTLISSSATTCHCPVNWRC